jgi:beta-alanine--pyruvate transaminase
MSIHDALPTPLSLDAWWLPFTHNRGFKHAPRLLERADGMWYRDVDGRAILDGASGLWCVNAGHNRAPIVDAIRRAAGMLDFAPTFQMAHPEGFRVADELVAILPESVDRVFFTNSGSEAVDTALKMALAYHRARGEPERALFVGRERGYHGSGFGGMSVGGITNNRVAFAEQLLPQVTHLPHTHDLARNAFARGQPTYNAESADALLAIVQQYGAERIAAVIVEPVAGSTGVLVPPVGYLERLRGICSVHGILLIFDEVITGFGRLGGAFASTTLGVTPDLMTLAKGLTNGAVPMGAVAVTHDVHDTIVDRATPGAIEFFHGYTYSGHPLAVAAARATLALYREENLFARAHALSPVLETAVHALADAPSVVDVRNFGMVAAVELAPRTDPATGATASRAADVFLECYARGVLVRYTGDTIALSPPLIASDDDLARIASTLHEAIVTIASRDAA